MRAGNQASVMTARAPRGRRGVATRLFRCAAALVATATALAFLPTADAGAAVTSVSGAMEKIAPPPSTLSGKLVSTTKIRVFDERQRFRLASALPIDLRNIGTYDQGTDLFAENAVKIAAGTLVSSHLIHADAPGSPLTLDGTITFDGPILGVVTRSSILDATDYLGAPSTAYSKGAGFRGLEFDDGDVVILPDQKTLRFQSKTRQQMDEIRVITQPPPLVTATLSADRTSVGAGVATVPLENIPSSALTASSKTDATQAASFSSAQLAATAMRRIDLSGTSLGSIAMRRIAMRRIPLGADQLDKILLSDVPVQGGWGPLLAGTRFEFAPLQTVTLGDVIDLPQVAALTLSDIDLSHTALGSIPAVALALGSLQLADIPLTDAVAAGTPQQRLQAWCDALGAATCASYGIVPGTPSSADGVTVVSLSVAGTDLASIAMRRIAMRRIDLSQTALGAVAMRRIAMRRIDGSPTPLGSLTLGAIPAAARGTIVNCTAVDCNNASLTLAAIPATAIIGTVADLFALSGQSPALDAVLDQITLEDVFPGVLPAGDLAWEDLDLRASPLQNLASPTEPVVTYSVGFTVAGTAAVALTVDFTPPPGFAYAPGTARLDNAVVADPTVPAPGLLRFTFTGVAAGPHTLTLGDRAGTDLGPKAASVKVSASVGTDSAQSTASTPVTVTESFELNGAAGDFRVLAPDTLYVSHISSATDTDLYRFDVSAQQAAGGASASIILGNVPADYDLKLYGPRATGAPSTADESQSSVADDGLEGSPQDASVAPDLASDIPTASGLGDVIAVSANRGARDEKIETGTLTAGTYWVQVSGYNGAFSAAPYVLREQITSGPVPPACQARVLPFTPPAAGTLADPASYPSNLNTIFLVAQQRMLSTYAPARVQQVLTDANQVANMGPDVVGRVVQVDWDPQVAAAYTAWAANRCSPDAAQAVAEAIRGVVDRIRAARPSLRNVVVVGDDGIIPMARVIDGTAISNERTYAETVDAATTNNELVGSVAAGRLLTDDVYGAPRVIDIENSNRQLYLPRVAVGRLVESPEDISAALQRFVAAGGRLDPLTVAGSSSVVAGYDFLADGSQQIASTLATKTTPRPSLINESWTRQDLTNALLGSNPPDVASINAHFDQSRLLPAAGNASGSETDLFTVADVNRAAARALLGRVLFSMGCHSGLSVSDIEVGTSTPDWAQTLTGAGQGALWAGNTGYGYGDTELVAYSEKLMSFFADALGTDATIGGALTAAKNRYKSETQPLSPYDEKVMQEVVLYGLPMYKPASAASGSASAAATSASSGPALVTDPSSGLPTASVPVTLTVASSTGPQNLHPVDTGSGVYYEVGGKTIQVQYRPVQPLVTRDVTQPDGAGGLTQVAHGALITGITSTDQLSFTPYYSRPLIDQTDHESLDGSVGDAVFPASILRVNSTVDEQGQEAQTLAVVPGQFRPNPATPGRGTERLFTNVRTLVHYTDASDTDFTAPTILRSTGSVVNGTAGFTVDTDSTARRVYVLYKSAGTTGSSTWQGIDLVRTGSSNHWTGGGLTTGTEIEYFVQAGDASGNWGISDNKASNFLATKPVASGGPLSVSVAGATVQGWYTGSANATVTDTASTAVSKSLDGAAFTAYTGPVAITGDGLHVLTVTDDKGNAATAVVPIDVSAPTVSATVAPDPAPGADDWRKGPGAVTITGVDGGGSGVAKLTYSVTGAQSTPSTTATGTTVTVPVTASGTSTVTFTATDTTGKTSATGSVAIKLDSEGPAVSCGSAPGSWSATDVSIPCTATDAGAGLANAADASFSLTTTVAAGTETATAATGSRSVCDLVPNCSTAGPVTGIKVDKKAPQVAITAPASGAQIPQGQTGVVATFTCTDAGSGMSGGSASCTARVNGGAPVASGASISTATTGPVSIVVTGVDAVGNTATATRTVTIVAPTYRIKLLYSATTAVKKGTKLLVEFQLLDSSGRNVSSASHVAVATDVDGGAAPPANLDGGVNSGNRFRFLTSESSEGAHYHYLLPTSSYSVGSHVMHFTIDGVAVPSVYMAPFKVKS